MDSPQFAWMPSKVLSKMEKRLEWESSSLAIKTIIKLQMQKSGGLLLTLKWEDHAHIWKSKSFIEHFDEE